MKEYQITVLKGDGIGPEIVDQAIKVLNKTAEKFDFKVNYQEEYIGGAAENRFKSGSGSGSSRRDFR